MQSSGARNDNNGVLTLTTPTITPTTIRNIEQFILDFALASYSQEEMGSFIPPLPHSNRIVSSSRCAYGSVRSELDNVHLDAKGLRANKKTSKNIAKNVQYEGGKMSKMGKVMSPMEEERSRLKRERNKLAAAKCRKRRVDQSRSLEEETENLESKQSKLKDLIAKLQEEKEQLESILSTHNSFCVKSKNAEINKNAPDKPKRPASLPLNPVKQESLSTPNGVRTPDWSSCFGTGFTPGNSPVFTPFATASMLTVLGMVTSGGQTENQSESSQIQPLPGKM